ncbi:FecR domain-containing protein [Niabella pedocola]|uniref:FecR domain-containing protein n=1 Tax=Niabella pedocola TaxID=1752077 RepID=A0ABS8PQM7_9BACT|nr:FecR family protein [Niabella pedocola]MCD2422612.1 FecR domain-containing protein [Niabella pedocola]
MEKDTHYYDELMRRYVTGECLPEEIDELMEYIRNRKSNRTLLAEIYRQYHHPEAVKETAITKGQSDRIRALLLETVATGAEKKKGGSIKRYLLAAAAVFIIGWFGFQLYQDRLTPLAPAVMAGKKEILPGTEKAVIHFSDGSSLRVDSTSKGILYNRNGLVISRSEEGIVQFRVSDAKEQAAQGSLFTTFTTPVGGASGVELPDGSKLWLNAGSTVRFPVLFSKQERQVQSSGEVYFEVAKDAARPFRVVSDNQAVEVLGTHFVVNTGADASVIKTTLLEGSIKLSGAGVSRILKPGQESAFVKGKGLITVTDKSNPEASMAWKDGYFEFDSADFKAMEEQIRKWYDVEFVYDRLPDNLFYGKIERDVPLSRVLQMLEIVGHIHFKTEGRKIYVTE